MKQNNKKDRAFDIIPLSRQCKKPTFQKWLLHYTWRGFFMARKGQHFQHYTKEFKMKAVKMYEEGNKSYHLLSEELGAPEFNPAQKLGEKIS